MQLKEITIRPVHKNEEVKYQKLMQKHHYLGFCPKIGETFWYVAIYRNTWISLISFTAAALKSKARDEWIGWKYRVRLGRLQLIINNNRFLILPKFHYRNLGSYLLSQCLKRIRNDWLEKFGHTILLIETFVDPNKFQGTIYKAAGWQYIGDSKGFARVTKGYSSKTTQPKMMFVKQLHRHAQKILSHPVINKNIIKGEVKMSLEAEYMWALPDFFKDIKDPRRAEGQRHSLSTVLAIVAGATLCGMKGYKAFYDWAKSLGPKARERFKCYNKNGKYLVPSEYTIRNILVRVDPDDLNKALQNWNSVHGEDDESMAIDGKTMCNAIDQKGKQTHIMSAIGHNTNNCYTQKK